MKPAEFREWMESQELRVEDVSHFTGLSGNTIRNFLSNKQVSLSTRTALATFKRTYRAPVQSTA
jgi:hypothetical protein